MYSSVEMMKILTENSQQKQLQLIPVGNRQSSIHKRHEEVFTKTSKGLSGIIGSMKFLAATTKVLIKGINI